MDSLRLPTLKQLALIFAVAVVFSAIAVLGYELIGTKLLSDEQTLLLMKRQGWFGDLFWPISIYAVVVNPLLEEIFWRGVILNALDRMKLPVKYFGIIWSSMAYAAFHYGIFRLVLFPVYTEVGILCLAFYGAFLSVVYRKTGSIITTAVTHGLLTDTAALMLMIDLFRRHPNFM
jgi:membrane protease YdiL (CAAX protease family)